MLPTLCVPYLFPSSNVPFLALFFFFFSLLIDFAFSSPLKPGQKDLCVPHQIHAIDHGAFIPPFSSWFIFAVFFSSSTLLQLTACLEMLSAVLQ